MGKKRLVEVTVADQDGSLIRKAVMGPKEVGRFLVKISITFRLYIGHMEHPFSHLTHAMLGRERRKEKPRPVYAEDAQGRRATFSAN